MEGLFRECWAAFENEYGRRPVWGATAPGRVNVIGEHTDYNDGFVFPMAIERGVVIAAAPAVPGDGVPQGKAKIFSLAKKKSALVALGGNIHPYDYVRWFDYVQGVIAGALQEEGNWQVPSFVAVIHSNVPLGGGLSSSAALEVATATLLEAILEKKMDPVRKALLCQKAEHEFAKMPCGIMDQFISVMGKKDHLMLLDCRSCEPTMIPFTAQEYSILITNSKVKHALSGSEYPERRSSCHTAAEKLGVASLREVSREQLEAGKERLTDQQYRRARHVVGEIERTVAAANAIEKGDYETLGQLMYASHQSLRDDFEVSCPELDILVEIAQKIGLTGGVYGSRMTGGGFGGCTVSLIQTAKMNEIIDTLRKEYLQQTQIEPEMFVTRPAQGAEIIDN